MMDQLRYVYRDSAKGWCGCHRYHGAHCVSAIVPHATCRVICSLCHRREILVLIATLGRRVDGSIHTGHQVGSD